MTTIFTADNEATARADVQARGTCEGYPQQGCPNDASNHILGWELCDECARRIMAPEKPAIVDISTVSLPNNAEPAPVSEPPAASLYASIVADFDAAFAQPLAELEALRAENAALRSALERREIWLTEESEITTRLRSQLERAHSALGQSIAAMDALAERDQTIADLRAALSRLVLPG